MNKLLYLSSPILSSLYPRTLYDFTQYLTGLSEALSLSPEPELAEINTNWKGIPLRQQRLKNIFEEYRELAADALLKLCRQGEESPQALPILLLGDNLMRCASDEQAERVELLSGFPCKDGWGSMEYLVRYLLQGGEEAESNIRSVAAKSVGNNQKGYYFYRIPDEFLPFIKEEMEPGKVFDDEFLAIIERRIFEAYGTRLCHVRSEATENKWYVQILHGGKKKKTVTEKDGRAQDALLQPLEWDVLIYDRRTKDIKMRMAEWKPGIANKVYAPAMSQCLTHSLFNWLRVTKFELEKFNLTKAALQALLDDASRHLSAAQGEEIEVYMAEASIETPINRTDEALQTEETVIRKNKDFGINRTMKEGSKLVPDGGHLTKVVLTIQNNSRGKQRSRVNITENTMTETRYPEFEEWLESHGISVISKDAANQEEE